MFYVIALAHNQLVLLRYPLLLSKDSSLLSINLLTLSYPRWSN